MLPIGSCRPSGGADTRRFTPEATGDVPFQREPGDTVVVFAGAFRPWHGAIDLVRAVTVLRARGRHDIKVVFVGGWPRTGARQARGRAHGVFVTDSTEPIDPGKESSGGR